jgi:cupin fold WbuC family metalloprotein
MIIIDKELLGSLHIKAGENTRKRINHNFHSENADTLQRMLNVMQPGTYIRPHRHITPRKREAFVILTGRVAVMEFSDTGEIAHTTVLHRESGIFGAEITPGVFHTLVCLDADSALYEIKDGPYVAELDKDWATWAPEEGGSLVNEFLVRLMEVCR